MYNVLRHLICIKFNLSHQVTFLVEIMDSLIPKANFNGFLEVYNILSAVREDKIVEFIDYLCEIFFLTEEYNTIWIFRAIIMLTKTKKDSQYLLDIITMIIEKLDSYLIEGYLTYILTYFETTNDFSINDALILNQLYRCEYLNFSMVNQIITNLCIKMRNKDDKMIFTILILIFGNNMDDNIFQNFYRIINSFEPDIRSFYFRQRHVFQIECIKNLSFDDSLEFKIYTHNDEAKREINHINFNSMISSIFCSFLPNQWFKTNQNIFIWPATLEIKL